MSGRRILAFAAAGIVLAAGTWLAVSTGPWSVARISGKLPAIVLDEAFAASRPELARALERRASPLIGKTRYAVPPLAEGPGAFLAAAAAAGYSPAGQASQAGVSKARGIIASPLYALAVTEAVRQAGAAAGGAASAEAEAGSAEGKGRAGLEALGGAVLVTPEWRGPLPPGLATVATDREPAYRAAGRAAGAWLAAGQAGQEGRREGTAAIIFRQGAPRPPACLEAFIEGYGEAGLGPPLVETMGDIAEDDTAIEAAAARLLAADIRLVLIAIGPGSRKAVEKLARPGIAVGLDSDEASEAATLPFAIVPDSEKLADALVDLAESDRKLERMDIPALLLRGSRSKDLVSGAEKLSSSLDKAGAQAR